MSEVEALKVALTMGYWREAVLFALVLILTVLGLVTAWTADRARWELAVERHEHAKERLS